MQCKLHNTTYYLLINYEKTEILIIGKKTSLRNNLEYCLTLDGSSVKSSVRNLGVLFDTNLSFESHVCLVSVKPQKIYLNYAIDKCGTIS